MVRRLGLLSFVWLVLCCLWIGLDTSQAAPVRFNLNQVATSGCDISMYVSLADEGDHLLTPTDPKQFEVLLSNKRILPSKVEVFKGAGLGTAFTVLFDVSKTMAGTPFDRAVDDVKGLIKLLGSKDRMAVISFGGDVEVRSTFTQDKGKLNKVLSNLVADQDKTQLYKAIFRAIELNRQTDPGLPKRRVLVLVSDGKDEGSGLTIEDVRRKCEKAQITIYALGYTKILPKFLNYLRRLSTLTGGEIWENMASGQPSGLAGRLMDQLNGQLVISAVLPASGIEDKRLPLSLKYSSGPTVISTDIKEIAYSCQVPWSFWSYPDSVLESLGLPGGVLWRWALLVVAALILLAILLILWLAIYGKKKVHEEPEGQVGVDPPIEPPIVRGGDTRTTDPSWPPIDPTTQTSQEIELIGIKGFGEGDKHRVVVGKNGIVIGRLSGEITINHPEISRTHAQISWDGENLFISDLDSTLGTKVNDIKVVAKTVIEDGDAINLGAVTFRLKILGTR